MTQRLDLAVVTKKLGVTVRELKKKAKVLPELEGELSEPWMKMANSIEEVTKELGDLAENILRTKTTGVLEVSWWRYEITAIPCKFGSFPQFAAIELAGEVPLLADCIEARRDQANRLHLLKTENAELKAKFERGKERAKEFSELKARVKAVGDFDGMEALLEQRAKEIDYLRRDIIAMRWKAAGSERRSASAYQAELCVLRRAWKELVENREGVMEAWKELVKVRECVISSFLDRYLCLRSLIQTVSITDKITTLAAAKKL